MDKDRSSIPDPLVVSTKPTVILLATDVAAAGSSVGLSLSKVGYKLLMFCANENADKLPFVGEILSQHYRRMIYSNIQEIINLMLSFNLLRKVDLSLGCCRDKIRQE